jgi:hypothetical protein
MREFWNHRWSVYAIKRDLGTNELLKVFKHWYSIKFYSGDSYFLFVIVFVADHTISLVFSFKKIGLLRLLCRRIGKQEEWYTKIKCSHGVVRKRCCLPECFKYNYKWSIIDLIFLNEASPVVDEEVFNHKLKIKILISFLCICIKSQEKFFIAYSLLKLCWGRKN